MKALLLADASRLSASLSEYEATRRQIDRAAYKTFTLSEADFYDLEILTDTVSIWRKSRLRVSLGCNKQRKVVYMT